MDCSTVNPKNNEPFATVPLGFKISPEEAALVLPDGCMRKMGYWVYADLNNYYIVDSGMVAFESRDDKTIRKFAYVVDGKTGELISVPAYKKN